MAHYLPCVTTAEGGISDIVVDGDNGLICKRKDPMSLACSLQTLLDDKSLRVLLGENARKKYESEFTEFAFEKRMVDILSSAL